MSKACVQVICGNGNGKTTAAIGKGIKAIAHEKTVTMIQFLKGNSEADVLEVLKRLEPEMKVFRFEKYTDLFEYLTDYQKQEELVNIRNGLNFAKKVITTGGCDLIILDEILGLVDQQLIKVDELKSLIEIRPDDMEMIITGKVFPEALREFVDNITKIEDIK